MDHLLLVEDEAALRNSLLRCVQGTPELDVRGVATLQEAIAALDAKAPHLVVLDLELPDGSGLDLVPELALRGLNVPVVVITAHLQRFQPQLPERSNLEILQKPFELAEFKRIVSSRLQQARTEPQGSAFTVADYLQLAGMARRSVILTVNDGTRVLGRLVVDHGNPRWAEDQHGTGEGAFHRLALLPRSEVSCRPLEAPFSKSNLNGSLEQLLIEAARRADELKRRPASKRPPGDEFGPESSRPTVQPPSQERESGAQVRLAPPPPPSQRPRVAPPAKPVPRVPAGLLALQPKTSGEMHAIQEKSVNLTKPVKVNLSQILTLDNTIKAAARADRQGSVLEFTGDIDAETSCAVATMALRQIGDATAELGLGKPSAWHVSVGPSTWYVVQARDELILTLGNINKNPISTLKKIAKSCGALA